MTTTQAEPPLLRRRGALVRVRAASRFVRFSAIGCTVVVPLVGAVSARSDLTSRQTLGIIVVGAAVHMFGYVLNDVVDVAIDRTEPRRRSAPLVRGSVSTRVAFAFASANVPLAVAATFWMDAPATAHAALWVAIVTVAAYDVWGKRVPIPIVMDATLALSFAALCIFGAIVAGAITSTTALLAAFLVVYMLMANGIHGALRDIANDARHGARTTAIQLGVEPLVGGGLRLPQVVVRFALALQVAMTVVSAAMLVSLHYSGWTAAYGATAWLVTSIAAVALLRGAIASADRRAALMVRGTLHLIAALGVVIAVLAPVMPAPLRVASVAIYVTPLLTYGWLLDAIRSVPDPRDPR